MDLSNAQEKFIHDWGILSTNWGVKCAMGKIHALLLVSKGELCADMIMDKLKMSRGNVNMNLKALENWKVIKKAYKPGERKDFYIAEKDLSKVFKLIIAERKRKELDPLLSLLEDINAVQPRCPESSEFCRVTKDLGRFAKKADHALKAISSSQAEWISKILIR